MQTSRPKIWWNMQKFRGELEEKLHFRWIWLIFLEFIQYKQLLGGGGGMIMTISFLITKKQNKTKKSDLRHHHGSQVGPRFNSFSKVANLSLYIPRFQVFYYSLINLGRTLLFPPGSSPFKLYTSGYTVTDCVRLGRSTSGPICWHLAPASPPLHRSPVDINCPNLSAKAHSDCYHVTLCERWGIPTYLWGQAESRAGGMGENKKGVSRVRRKKVK